MKNYFITILIVTAILLPSINCLSEEINNKFKFDLATDIPALHNRSYGLELGLNYSSFLNSSLIYKTFNSNDIDDNPTKAVPVNMWMSTVRYFFDPERVSDGWYAGIAATYILTFTKVEYPTDIIINKKSNRFGTMITAGYENYFFENRGLFYRIGFGHGSGAPFIGKEEDYKNYGLHLFYLNYIDCVIGYRF